MVEGMNHIMVSYWSVMFIHTKAYSSINKMQSNSTDFQTVIANKTFAQWLKMIYKYLNQSQQKEYSKSVRIIFKINVSKGKCKNKDPGGKFNTGFSQVYVKHLKDISNFHASQDFILKAA